jgi:hypothetical protein
MGYTSTMLLYTVGRQATETDFMHSDPLEAPEFWLRAYEPNRIQSSLSLKDVAKADPLIQHRMPVHLCHTAYVNSSEAEGLPCRIMVN